MQALAVLPLKVLHALLNLTLPAFLWTLTAMLFRPPDLKIFPFDRVALVVLVIILAARVLLRCDQLHVYLATWPLVGLLALGFWGTLTQPYDAQAWSLFAAKWAVPFVMFHAAGMVFKQDRQLRLLETFLLGALLYLSAISVLFLIGATDLIIPRFITDGGIGIHADRARGPFLQAVANGVTLNLLGLIALDAFRRKRLLGPVALLLLIAVPLALLATQTRAVWAAAASSAVLLLFVGDQRVRRIVAAVCVSVVLSAAFLWVQRAGTDSLLQRLEDQSPLEFRSEMYRAGLQMFVEKPLLGWGNEWQVQPEIERRMSDFHPEYYAFHNTFLELVVQRGLLGLGLYVWLMVCLIRLRRPGEGEQDSAFMNQHFRKLWPLLLLVYLLNASAVVMNYQFVNALLFTMAGILAAHGRSQRVAAAVAQPA
jgi:O-antigen ligase